MERGLDWLKRHGFLIAGVGLPLLLVVALVVARMVPRYLVDDPLHDLVYAIDGTYDGSADRRVQDVRVEGGRLVVRWTLVDQPSYQPRRRVLRADVAGGEVVELAVPVPELDEFEAPDTQVVYEIEGLEGSFLDTSSVSPDGYSFTSTYSGGGLFGELFFSRSRGTRTRIEKEGRLIDVPRLATSSYYGAHFLGWVVPGEDGR